MAASYDGRKRACTPASKISSSIGSRSGGIAVGLSTKILPHNFNELIDASIKYLKGRSFRILPDFLTEELPTFPIITMENEVARYVFEQKSLS